jgi:hypothetical protein
MDQNKPPVFELKKGDRIIVGFVAVPKGQRSWTWMHLAVERVDGTRWCRSHLKDGGRMTVQDTPTEGKTNDQLKAKADKLVADIESEGVRLVMAVYKANCTGEEFMEALEASEFLAAENPFDLDKGVRNGR